MGTETLRPSSTEANNNIFLFPNTGESLYEDVDEAVSDGDTTYGSNDYLGGYPNARFGLPAHSGSGVINSVTVYGGARAAATPDRSSFNLGVRTTPLTTRPWSRLLPPAMSPILKPILPIRIPV